MARGKLAVLTAPFTEMIDHAGAFIQMGTASMPIRMKWVLDRNDPEWRVIKTVQGHSWRLGRPADYEHAVDTWCPMLTLMSGTCGATVDAVRDCRLKPAFAKRRLRDRVPLRLQAAPG